MCIRKSSLRKSPFVDHNKHVLALFITTLNKNTSNLNKHELTDHGCSCFFCSPARLSESVHAEEESWRFLLCWNSINDQKNIQSLVAMGLIGITLSILFYIPLCIFFNLGQSLLLYPHFLFQLLKVSTQCLNIRLPLSNVSSVDYGNNNYSLTRNQFVRRNKNTNVS